MMTMMCKRYYRNCVCVCLRAHARVHVCVGVNKCTPACKRQEALSRVIPQILPTLFFF